MFSYGDIVWTSLNPINFHKTNYILFSSLFFQYGKFYNTEGGTMPPFFFSRWMKLIKSQPSKWKAKKNFETGYLPFPFSPPSLPFFPFSPLICSLPLHSQLCSSSPPSSYALILHSQPCSCSSSYSLTHFPFFPSPNLFSSPDRVVVAPMFLSYFSHFSLHSLSIVGWRQPSPSTRPTSSRPTSQTSSKTSLSTTASSSRFWARSVPRSES